MLSNKSNVEVELHNCNSDRTVNLFAVVVIDHVKSKVVSDALTKSPQSQDNSQMLNIPNTWRAQRNLQYM